MVCPNDFERFWKPLEVVPYIRSLCKVGGMYYGNINGTTRTVAFWAMTALKRDGSALIPASLVNVLKGMYHNMVFKKVLANPAQAHQEDELLYFASEFIYWKVNKFTKMNYKVNSIIQKWIQKFKSEFKNSKVNSDCMNCTIEKQKVNSVIQNWIQ